MTVKVGGKPGPQKTFYKGFDIRRVLVGLGIGVAPTFIAGPDIKRGKLVRVLPEYTIPLLGAYVVYPRTRFLSRRARCFIDFLVARFGHHPHWDNFESSS